MTCPLLKLVKMLNKMGLCSRCTRPLQAAEKISTNSADFSKELAFAWFFNRHDDLTVFRNIKKAVALFGIDDDVIGIGKHLVPERTSGQTVEFRSILCKKLHLEESIGKIHEHHLIGHEIEVGGVKTGQVIERNYLLYRRSLLWLLLGKTNPHRPNYR